MRIDLTEKRASRVAGFALASFRITRLALSVSWSLRNESRC